MITNADQNIADAIVPLATRVAVPGTATSAGELGQYAQDATHLYICLSHNVWVRCTLATW